MLITLPNHDLTTSYLSAWSEEVIDIAERNGIRTIPLRSQNVTRSHVTKTIKSKNPNFLAFNGHGSEISIAGYNDELLITLGENENLLKSRIVHAVSCNSAMKLGKACQSKAFIGYDNIFWLYMDGNKTNIPLKDMKVKPILESALEAPKQLAKRKTAGEAYEESQKRYQKHIDELTLSSSKHTTEELQIILPFLHWNKQCQKLHGDPNARV